VNYLRIAQAIALIAASVQIVACDHKKGYSIEDLQAHGEFAKEMKDYEYESALISFNSDEKFPTSKIYGDIIPEAFKGIQLEKDFLYNLQFKSNSPYDLTYVEFVDELNISCNGDIEVSDHGKNEQITSEKFFGQGKWRPIKFTVCGKITVPEGRMLIIKARDSSKVQDLELITSPNSHLSIDFGNIEYTGAAVEVSVDLNSVLKLFFPYTK